MTDDERAFVADDAVSNRSDDTALEEAESGKPTARIGPRSRRVSGIGD